MTEQKIVAMTPHQRGQLVADTLTRRSELRCITQEQFNAFWERQLREVRGI